MIFAKRLTFSFKVEFTKATNVVIIIIGRNKSSWSSSLSDDREYIAFLSIVLVGCQFFADS